LHSASNADDYFHKLYNSIHDKDSKNIFDSKRASSINNSCITVKEVMDPVRLQKKSEICWSQ